MMYHVSSTSGDGQLISPEIKYNLLFKKAASNAQKTLVFQLVIWYTNAI